MGLLKHVCLPIWSLLHGAVVFLVVVKGDISGAIALFDWPAKDGESQELTMWEQHCFGIIAGVHLAFWFGCVAGIFMEHSHFRAMLAAMEGIYWGYGGYDAAVHGFPCFFAYAMAGLAVVGLAVHAKEPGLLTADKGKAKNG